jgi:hypothetical protein
MIRKRGNPNWAQPILPASVLCTEFEMQVRQLHLTAERYVVSAELRSWCEENRKPTPHPRMAARCVGHPRRPIFQQRRVTFAPITHFTVYGHSLSATKN